MLNNGLKGLLKIAQLQQKQLECFGRTIAIQQESLHLLAGFAADQGNGNLEVESTVRESLAKGTAAIEEIQELQRLHDLESGEAAL